jgi:hypothetical protein
MNNTSQRRTRRTSEEWALVLRQAESSPLSIKRFCAQENISTQTFYGWRKRLRLNDVPLGFTPVVIARDAVATQSHPASAKTASTVEIVLRNGRIVRIAGEMNNAKELCTLLAIAEGDAPC